MITNALKRQVARHLFKPVEAGNYLLSIQASEGHYCSPRRTLNGSSDYSSFEVAVLNKRTGKIINCRKSSVMRSLPCWEELVSHGWDGTVFGWVSPDLVQDLFLHLGRHQYKQNDTK